MSMTYWQGLTANLAVIVVAVLFWTHAEELLSGVSRAVCSFVIAAIGCGALAAVMLMPVSPEPGVFYDLRAAIIALFGAYGGIVPAVLVAATALVLRISHGGAGVYAGVLVILLAFAIAVIFRLKRPLATIGPASLTILALSAAAANVASQVLLPPDLLASALYRIGVPAFLLSFAGVLCGGALLWSERRRRELFRLSERFRSLVEAMPDALNLKDRSGRFVVANAATARLMQVPSADDLIGRTDFDFYPRELAEKFSEDERRVWETGKAETFEQTLARAGGEMALMTLKAPLFDETGAMVGLISQNRDVSVRRRLQVDLAEAHRRLGIALDNMADGLVQFDRQGNIIFCNQRYREMFPKTAELRVPGANIAEIIRTSVERGEEIVNDMGELERLIEHDSALVRREGANIISLSGDRWVESRTTILEDGNALSVLSEISDRVRTQRRLETANLQLATQAMTDGLTGLSNRRYFDERLLREFEKAACEGTGLTVLLFDVDHFKSFNDIYGHLAGDDCLRLVGRCLRMCLTRASDVVARFGGEEFVALLPGLEARPAMAAAEKVRRAVEAEAQPHSGSARTIVTVSVGVFSGRPGVDVASGEEMLSLADAALYRAKDAGRNRVELHSAGGGRRRGADAAGSRG